MDRWSELLHPSGAQTWGAHIGREVDDSWRGFVALEGYDVGEEREAGPRLLPLFPVLWEIEASLRRIEGVLAPKAAGSSASGARDGSVEEWRREFERYKGRLEKEQKKIAADRRKVFEEGKKHGHSGHDIVFAEQFAQWVRKMSVKMVVLTTCRGAVRGQARWRGLAAALLRAGVPVVVGMQYAITQDAAIIFSHGFYDAIAQGASVDEAVSLGRARLIAAAEKGGDPGGLFDDFGIPVIYSRMTRHEDLILGGAARAGRPAAGDPLAMAMGLPDSEGPDGG